MPSSTLHARDSDEPRVHHTFTYCSPFNESEILYWSTSLNLSHQIAAVCFPPFVCEPPPLDKNFASCEYHHPVDAESARPTAPAPVPVQDNSQHYEPFGFDHLMQSEAASDPTPKTVLSDLEECDRECDCNKIGINYEACWTNCLNCLHEHGYTEQRADRAADRDKCYQHLRDCGNLSDEQLELCMRKVWECLDAKAKA
jgi:hypothetical protein